MSKKLFCAVAFFFVSSISIAISNLYAVEFSEFQSPPDSARPWVYWFIMDGNLSKEGITADLESMAKQGIGGIILMEVNVGVNRGKVDFMSEEWKKLFAHAVHETERLGLQLTLNSGPGWTGSGGPWIKPEQSMLFLVAAEKKVTGPAKLDEKLPVPTPRRPYFGGSLPPDQEKARREFFKDVCVLAFPTLKSDLRINDIDEKAFYVRHPYSSRPNVKPRIKDEFHILKQGQREDGTIPLSKIINLTDRLDSNGVLKWEVPQGNWTILRFAATSNGANTRPAPHPALGLESSKMDRDYFDVHFKNFVEQLFDAVGKRQTDGKAGWCYMHIDSWEMGPQNFSKNFIDEFRKRRLYDPTPFLPAYSGFVVDNMENAERFLWDVRQTSQELIIENHGEYLRELAHKNNMKLSIEPYDMSPFCDMSFGAIADVPMCEFWSAGYGFNTIYSCFEAASIAHTHGKSIVGAEAFTSSWDAWRQNPKSMKLQGDWAFCAGINRITFHRFQHQPLLDRVPGFAMGINGVHWERTQTWWNLVSEYHRYLARCQFLLQKGRAVSDILYLLPEGAPEVFTPPNSALTGSGVIKDQRGYRFDGCDPKTLIELATVKNGKITFENNNSDNSDNSNYQNKISNSTEYRLLVLPNVMKMTPELLTKIDKLARDGATIIVPPIPPFDSPSLQNSQLAGAYVRLIGEKIWGLNDTTNNETKNTDDSKLQIRPYYKGRVIKSSQTPFLVAPISASKAKWIWYPEGNPEHDAPAGTRLFRKTFSLQKSDKVKSASFLATADNELTVTINGKKIYQTTLSEPLKPISFGDILKNGENVIELKAVNSPSDQRNPAGLLASFEIRTINEKDTETVMNFVTDESWESAQLENENTNENNNVTKIADIKKWKPAKVLADFGKGIWKVADYSHSFSADQLYPDYRFLTRIFENDGVVPDLVSPEESLRFFHRQEGETEIYFLSNKSANQFQGDVSFRTVGKKATIWDPKTGQRFRDWNSSENLQKGQTTIPLYLDGLGSAFVIFDNSRDDTDNLPVWENPISDNSETLIDLSEDWTVSFEAKRGAPSSVKFDRLQDWSKSDDEGIRYFSGIAEYEKSFELKRRAGDRLYLSLGEVEVMTRVRINGKLAGTCWSNPYRLDVTDYIKDGKNEIKIEVANLWINRLIGDSKLPPEKQITWTTLKAYNSDSKLLPSGLIGPVKIISTK
ncbi:MAG: hypothetical protein LBB88_03290 [Planctomycetaceae bacterium]|jgi:hypothetical protein|nr:hypothetical protein [Planctomycetaceae bacterium]